MSSPVPFDFETKAIAPRPDYPPSPVGLAINGEYLHWGHHDSKGTSVAATKALHKAWGKPFVCHNAAFDIEVAVEHLGLPLPNGENINDTMILAFLHDPYGELSLKPLAERYLGIPPTERDAVRDWLYANKVVKKNVKRWGAYISAAPGELVGPYAIGDTARTAAMYEYLEPIIKERGMWEAYRRECDIMPMLLDNSMRGVPLAKKRLAADTARYEEILEGTDKLLRQHWRRELGSTPPANWDSGDEIGLQLRAAGIQMPLTPTGKDSSSKASIEATLPDGKTKALLLYRSAIEKSLSTYLRPWAQQGGLLHCTWNQVRDYSDAGARTGRLSSSPNLQNITNPERYADLHAKMKAWGADYDWIEFPNLRGYIEAPRGYELFALDYSQQEIRVLAHFEDGALAQGFRDNPTMDVHEYVRALIREQTGHDIPRKHVKNINFAKIYGAGVAKLSEQMGVDFETGSAMVRAYEAALPSVKSLQKEINALGRNGEHITTLGGRHYFAEPASMVQGELRTFEYKMLNYLIQGSSADQTKEAMRLWWQNHLKHQRGGTRFLLSVHDELVGMAPAKDVERAALELQACMVEAIKLDVPVIAEPKYGQNYGAMK